MSDTGDGVCCECDTIGNPYMYWACNLRETFISLPNGGFNYEIGPSNRHTFVGNPLLAGRFYDLRSGHVDNAPDKSRWQLSLIKTRASATGAIGHENKNRFSSHQDFKVKLFPSTHVDDFVFGVHPNRFDGNINTRPEGSASHSDPIVVAWKNFGYIPNEYLNNFLVNAETSLLRTIACYHDDVQSHVVCTGIKPKVQRRRSDPTEIDLPYDYRISTDVVLVSTVDIATQSTIYENEFYQFGYDTRTISVGGAPIEQVLVFYSNMEQITRANYCANPWYLVVSTYDDWKEPYVEWFCVRSPINPTGVFAGGISTDVPTNKPIIVRASFHSYTYGENPSKAPWVIAVNKSNQQWVTGQWAQSVTIEVPGEEPEDPPEQRPVPQLADADVVNVLNTGVLSNNAVLLCYNRVRQREFAIWIDKGPRRTDWSNVPGGRPFYVLDQFNDNPLDDVTVYAVSYAIQQVIIYDSERTPANLVWALRYVFYWPPEDPTTEVDLCTHPQDVGRPNYGQEDDIFYGEDDDVEAFGNGGQYLTKPGPPPRHIYDNTVFRRTKQYTTLITPTFITCDAAGQVYIGSPNFIAKTGRYAEKLTSLELDPALNTEERWTCVFSDYYPTKTVLTQNCDGELIPRRVPVQKEYDILGSGINYGLMNNREFCIVPASYGIVVKGVEGVPEMATTKTFAKTPYYTPEFNVVDYTRHLWLTDWVFSADGKQRSPCVEEAFLEPIILATEKDNANMPYEQPSGVVPHPNIPTIEALGTFKYRSQIQADTAGRYDNLPSSQPRGLKRLVSRRYGDELMNDFFVAGPGRVPGVIFGVYPSNGDELMRVNRFWTLPSGGYNTTNAGEDYFYEFNVALSTLGNTDLDDPTSISTILMRTGILGSSDPAWEHSTYLRYFVGDIEINADRDFVEGPEAPAVTLLVGSGENHWWVNNNSARLWVGDFFGRQYRGALLDVCDVQ